MQFEPHEIGVEPREIGADLQADLYQVAAEAAREYFLVIESLPRWRRWLISKLAPPYPQMALRLPAGEYRIGQRVTLPPLTGLVGESDD